LATGGNVNINIGEPMKVDPKGPMPGSPVDFL